MNKKVLLIGYGNPGRLDDGLGPALSAAVEKLDIPGLTVDADYQLSIEDAAAVAQHDVVIFADADTSGAEPFSFKPVEPVSTLGFSSHSLSPQALMALAVNLFGAKTKGYILAIGGYEFNEFGERLSERARANLEAALLFIEQFIRQLTSNKTIPLNPLLYKGGQRGVENLLHVESS